MRALCGRLNANVIRGTSGALPNYRVDGGGHISAPALEFECDSNEQAIEEARKRIGTKALEIWGGAEVIYRFEAME